ncbi:class I SAM-dependent methyltransferase [Sulfitobacter sp. HNIBRBA3233]|uniref:class I SAM-dependent methyltransferase n=1 Tax=Sulfitobacter marinivivus TaxID=3158558 RepID=UPI0032DF90A3
MTTIAKSSDKGRDLPVSGTDIVAPLSSRELFWRARYTRGTEALAHLPLLFWLVTDLRPGRSVTVGIDTGVLHFGLCQALDKNGYDGVCYGFGTWKDAEEVPAALREHNAREYDDMSYLSVADVSGAADGFGETSVDLLVCESRLDGDEIDALIALWLPRMTARGVIVLSGGQAQPGLLSRRLSAQGIDVPAVHFEFGGGLDILLVGDTPSERMGHLAGLDGDSSVMRSVERVLSRMGALHVNEWRATDKAEWARKLSGEVTEVRAARDRAQARLEELEKATAAQAERIEKAATLEEKHALSSAAVQQLTQRATDQEREIETLRAELEQTRTALEQSKEEGTTQAAVLRDALAEAKTSADSVERARAAAALELGQARAALAEAEEALEALRGAGGGTIVSQTGLADLTAHLETVQQEVLGLRHDAKRAQQEIETLQTYRDKLLARIRTQDRQIKEMETHKNALSADRDALRHTMNEMMRSSSWRLTSPLRRARSALGKG